MADPWSNDDSATDSGMQVFMPDPSVSNTPWDFGYPNPYGSLDEILNKGLGPLSPEAINGSPLLYTDPQVYFRLCAPVIRGCSAIGFRAVAAAIKLAKASAPLLRREAGRSRLPTRILAVPKAT